MTSTPHSVTVSTTDLDSVSEGSNPSEAAIPELYLIAHKVRGAVAFDIAIQMEMDDGVWWILPSVGHRAYPFWHTPIYKLSYEDNGEGIFPLEWLEHRYPMPAELQDFYEVTTPILSKKAEVADRQSGLNLLSQLGLVKDRPHTAVSGKLTRRI